MRRRLRKGGDFINSFMAWVGGKKALRDEILARFPRNYKRYIEVFGGAGWVLFHKPPGNDFEVFNDFNGNLVNLYRCVREQPEALRNELRYIQHRVSPQAGGGLLPGIHQAGRTAQ